MDEALIKAIIDGLKNSGHESLIKLFEIDSNSEVEDVIKGLKEESGTFLELINKNKGYQSEFDKLISKAVIKREDNLKKKYNFIKKDSFTEDDDDDDDDDEGDEASKKKGSSKKTMSANEKLENQIEELRKLVKNQMQTQTLEKKKEVALKMLKEHKIPERYVQFFDLNSEDIGLDEQFKTINDDFQEFKKSILEETQTSTGFPIPKDIGEKVSDAEVDEIVENL